LSVCLGMGMILWESHGNGNRTYTWGWEWEGMGICFTEMGGSGNVKKIYSRSSLRHKNQCRRPHLARRATPNDMEITHVTHIKQHEIHIRTAMLQKMIPFHFFDKMKNELISISVWYAKSC